MLVSICSVCNEILRIREEEKPGLYFTHTYCNPHYLMALEEINEDLSQRRPEL